MHEEFSKRRHQKQQQRTVRTEVKQTNSESDLDSPLSPLLVRGSERGIEISCTGTTGSKSRTPRRVKGSGKAKAGVREKVGETDDQDQTSEEEECMEQFEHSHDTDLTSKEFATEVRGSHDVDITREEEEEDTADNEELESAAGIAQTSKTNTGSVLGKRRKRERYMAIAKKLKVCIV